MTDKNGGADPRRKAKNIAIVIYIALIIIAAVVLLPNLWYLWLIILAVCLFRVISLAAPQAKYQCHDCHEVFSWRKRGATLRPTAADLYGTEDAPKCPRCGSKAVSKAGKR